MSCGEVHETPCAEVLDQVWAYLDGEIADDARCDQVRQHLDECSPCLRKYGIEREVKALVARSCGGDDVPGGLKDKIRARITQVRIETTQVEYRVD